MKHLTPAEIVDAAERPLAGESSDHVRGCASCRGRVEAASRTMAQLGMVEVPEPSPLFWEHFSARVRAAVADEQPRRSWTPAWRVTFAGALAAAVLVTALFVYRLPRPPALDRAAGPAAPAELPAPENAVDDGTWALVADVSEGLDWDDAEAAGLVVRPGAAERAVLQLSDEQQLELARLLEFEIGRLKS